MTRARGVRSVLAAVVACAAAGALIGWPAAADAVASTASGSAGRVLIVHVAGSAHDVAQAASDATRPGVTVRHTLTGAHAFSVEVVGAQDAAATSRLASLPHVTGVEQPVARHFFDTPAPTVPDDPGYTHERGYLDAVDAPAAWQVQHGSPTVKIAVVDSGVDVGHPDLAHKIVGRYNAATGSDSVTDSVGHGTFVAGVTAAQTDNALGIAGAGYDTDILAVKIATSDGDLPIDNEVAGIRWAVRNGADVINLSFGGPEPSAVERSAVEYAISHGVLVVAAAGNTHNSVPQYPAAYPGVVAVGSTDPAHQRRAAFSSYGSWVTVAAPGVGIYSTTPRQPSQDFATTSGYSAGDGTSFSAPLVAGEAALLKAQDPAATPAFLRSVLIASAHGYAHLGLGGGQVDFANALAHLPPGTTPSQAAVTGTKDDIALEATSTAPDVEFAIDGTRVTAPVAVQDGTAIASISSWGFANGQHTLQAYDCSAFDTCASSPATSDFTLANDAPTVTSPVGAQVSSGRFTVTADHAGGGLRLLVDGKPAGFDPTAPYAFPVDGSALTDGSHTLQVVLCSTDGSRCAGPASPTVAAETRSLHPTTQGVSPSVLSPTADGGHDTSRLTFDLPDAETVTVQVVDAAGRVVDTDDLGALAAGTHFWTWDGRAGGRPLTDGSYQLQLLTTAYDNSTELKGFAARPATIDTRAPSVRSVSAGGTRFYPVPDHYQDLFLPHALVGEASRVQLVVRNHSGHVVRVITHDYPAGAVLTAWNGRDQHGHLVPAGTYRWQYVATDRAGNVGTGPVRTVTVSDQRLMTRTFTVRHQGASASYAAGTNTCATASRKHSTYHHGLLLTNGCSPRNGDLVFASYKYTVPHAVRYQKVSLSVYGFSSHRPSQLAASFQRTDQGLEIPRYVTIHKAGARWVSIATVPATAHISTGRRVYLSVLLDGDNPGRNDFDMKYARIQVKASVLR